MLGYRAPVLPRPTVRTTQASGGSDPTGGTTSCLLSLLPLATQGVALDLQELCRDTLSGVFPINSHGES